MFEKLGWRSPVGSLAQDRTGSGLCGHGNGPVTGGESLDELSDCHFFKT
jgi:hypothetical protein